MNLLNLPSDRVSKRFFFVVTVILGVIYAFVAMSNPQNSGAGGAISQQELDEVLKGLDSKDTLKRLDSIQILLDLDKDSIPVLSKRLYHPQKASGESMKRVLYSLRKKLKEEGNENLHGKEKEKGSESDDTNLITPPQFLKILAERRRDDNVVAWRGALEVMAILVALSSMGTTEAILPVIDFAGQYESAFRKEIYQILIWLGEKALPAALLRRNSKDEDVKTVVESYLTKMNMTRPAQQVQLQDTQILVEVLRIFSSKKFFDTIDTITALLNSENSAIRGEARKAILSFGKSALWAMRREYRNYTGEEADSSWSTEEIATKLFSAQDADRFAPLDSKLKEGLEFQHRKRFDEMEKVFKEILAIDPMYPKKGEMVQGYIESAKKNIDRDDIEHAVSLLKIASRLNTNEEVSKKIMALYYYCETLRELGDGIADPELMREAVRLDPDFKDAKIQLKKIENVYRSRKIKGYRIVTVGGIGLGALILLVLIVVKKW